MHEPTGRAAGPAVRAVELRKSYGATQAVDGVSFEIQRGEVFALLGPNGAGKTTTVEMLEGYRRPDSGSARVLGEDPWKCTRLKARMGVMLQEGGVYPTMRPLETLALFANFYPGPHSPRSLLEQVGLTDSADTPYRRLSGGQKQRLSLALALLPQPEIAFLDEPTAGMDPQARRDTWGIIERLRDEGVTILLTTHYLEEAERLADRVGIMASGRILALDSPSQLVRQDASVVHLHVSAPVPLERLRSLPTIGSVEEIRAAHYRLNASDIPSLLVDVTSLLRELGVIALEIRTGAGSLEEVYLQLTGTEPEA